LICTSICLHVIVIKQRGTFFIMAFLKI
jgi:hypothetical protein